MKSLLGDFSAKVGRENIFKLTIGNESLQQGSNVRNIDLLVVALDKPERADEVSLAQLVNTGQPYFYKYLLFKVCAPQ